MTDKTFMRADEVAEELDVSKAYVFPAGKTTGGKRKCNGKDQG